MKPKKPSPKKEKEVYARQPENLLNAEETPGTGLNEDPETKKIHEAMDDDAYDRLELELDD